MTAHESEKRAPEEQAPGDRRATRVDFRSTGAVRFGAMLGTSPAMRAAFAALERAAEGDSPVLLRGESGTGKKLAAQSLHAASARRERAFVVVDCASRQDSLENELFGGAGAGAFEHASGGTLLLQEIAALGAELQSKLLRAIERRQIKRTVGMNLIGVDVRVVAATRRELLREVDAGRFRPDLYYRIAVIDVCLPPLRERLDDIALLVDWFLDRSGSGARPEAESIRARARDGELRSQPWAGNVRELESWVERNLAACGAGPSPPAQSPPLRLRDARKAWIDEFEQRYLREILERHRDNVSAAARAAGVDRKYFHRLLVKHRLR